MKKIKDYSKRQWLNVNDHPSTGSVVAYHGSSPWLQGKKRDMLTMLEVSDCHSKVRLHRTDVDSMEDFIVKMEKLSDVVNDFIAHLRG
ncbi:MAG: hypothetical protein ABSB40_13500 [Nitrososphaeria archaeon]